MSLIKSNEKEFRYEIKTKDKIDLKDFYGNSVKLLKIVRMSAGI
jgi:hypothetical protein